MPKNRSVNKSFNFGSYDNYFLESTNQNNLNNNNYEEGENKGEMNMRTISNENQGNNYNITGEIFGINFKFNIIFRLFNYKITKDLSLLNNIEGNYTEIVSLYSIFKYKYLEKESSLGIKFTTQNNFVILILHGEMELFDIVNKIVIIPIDNPEALLNSFESL